MSGEKEDPITQIPDAIEEEVLEILDDAEHRWASRLLDLFRRHPEHEAAVRTWLRSVVDTDAV